MKRYFSGAMAIALIVLLTSCGGGSNGGGSAPGGAFVPGKWTFSLFPSTSNLFGPTAELDVDLTQSGSTISSTTDTSIDNVSCAGMHLDSSTGTASEGKIKLVFKIDSETITLEAGLDPDGKSVNEVNLGKFSASEGPCLGGQHGVFSGNLIPSLTGTSTGTMLLGGLNTEPGVTATLAEDPNFNVSGSMVVTDDPCFSSLAIAPANPGIAIGSLFSFEMTDGVNTVDFVGQLTEVSPGIETSSQVNVVSGCTEQSGEMTLTQDADSAATMRVPVATGKAAPKISPLLVERMKALLAARRQNAQ